MNYTESYSSEYDSEHQHDIQFTNSFHTNYPFLCPLKASEIVFATLSGV